ncbi:olfactory receptor 5V1-like [Rhinatrema bivittatum]|uniref:olfactory receptor 5V1-like n=1 Tax=Rhinatrema bivittatum TaxID=194408 RepID=UPI001128E6C8|nr:olfactory receptor 5V1-like [Rhinatrema bivittatum]
MENKNQSVLRNFFLLGFGNKLETQITFFVIFLMIYFLTFFGNLTILTAVRSDSRLHTPMYFFLCNLSFLDICYISVTMPKMLANMLSNSTSISFAGCIAQIFFFIGLVSTEFFLLSVMAYDRYVAICNPLLYHNIMSKRVCIQLATAPWMGGFLNSLVHTLLLSQLSYCKSNKVNQYFCDIPPLLALACGDKHINEIVLLSMGAILGMGSFLLTIISYVHIISTILKIRSAEGKRKAFSTCTSHLIVVSLFCGTGIFTYVRPSSSYSLDKDRLVSVLYGVVTPMLNPIIYSLRNKDVKGALLKVLGRKTS